MLLPLPLQNKRYHYALPFLALFALLASRHVPAVEVQNNCEHDDSLIALRCVDGALDAKIKALETEQLDEFHTAVRECASPVDGLDWLVFRQCVLEQLPNQSATVAEALENWSVRLQGLSEQLEAREALLNKKDDLLDDVAAIIDALNQSQIPPQSSSESSVDSKENASVPTLETENTPSALPGEPQE
ncbi:MAG: hypothetical protein HWE20_16570 [Gammaproteobacteria bacterium]|nr:hypothetical protein [Gammaproteobacteria bacterium]